MAKPDDLRGYVDIEANRHGEAELLAPITYLRLVLIASAGYFMYGEIPDAATFDGCYALYGPARSAA